MINFVEIELGGDSWSIGWDVEQAKVICTGRRFGRKYCSTNFKELTPSIAFDLAMMQLSWLRKGLSFNHVDDLCFHFRD